MTDDLDKAAEGDTPGVIPARVHYRESDDPAVTCGTCSYFTAGSCAMFEAPVSPSKVCDEWQPILADHAVTAALKPVPSSAHNLVLARAQKRVDELEPNLAAIVAPILADAGATAAHAFRARATNFLTASIEAELAAADITAKSTMVAVYPRASEAEAIAEDDGEDPAIIHVTLCYLGETDDDTLDAVRSALATVAGTHPPLEGHVGGVGAFDDNGNGVPAILLPDVPGLAELRQAVCEAVIAADADYSRTHGYTPHLTIAYRDSGSRTPGRSSIGTELHFDAIKLVQGDQVVAELTLTGAPALTAASAPPQWAAPAPDELVDVQALVAQIKAKTEPVRLAMVKGVMTPALEQAGVSWDVTNPLTEKVLAQTGSQITHIAETTQLNVMRIVKTSYDQGLSIPDTAEAIQAGMKDASVARATLIARTELAGAVNGGSLAATQIVSQATDTPYYKQWMTAPGAMYPRHEDYDGLDGQTVQLDETFRVGEDELQFPGDPDGSPEEVCNCRCSMSYTEDPAELDDNSGGFAGGDSAPGGIPVGSESLDEGGEAGLTEDAGAAAEEDTTADELAPVKGESIDVPSPVAPSPITPPSLGSRPIVKLQTSDDPYLASLQKERYTTGNRISGLKTRDKKGIASPKDYARLTALMDHQQMIRDLLADPEVSLQKEREVIADALEQARNNIERYGTSDTLEQRIELLTERQEALDALDVKAPPVAPEPAGPVGPIASDLAAIKSRAEWLTASDAARKSAEMSMSGYTDRYYPKPGFGPNVAEYLQEQMNATIAAGARVQLDMQVPTSLTENVGRAQAYTAQVEADRQVALEPLKAAVTAARDDLSNVIPQIRWDLARSLFDKAYADLSFTERSTLTDHLADDPRYSTLKAKIDEATTIEVQATIQWGQKLSSANSSLRLAKQELATTQRAEALRVLSGVRDWGATDTTKLAFDGKARGVTKARKLLEASQAYYPRAWIEKMRTIDAGTANRGYHQNYGGKAVVKVSTSDRSAVAGDPDGLPVAIHELGHEVEDTVPFIRELESSFYEWRTRGGTFDGPQESLRSMNAITGRGGYGRDEKAREDKFSAAYMGKWYANGRNYELVSMGIESLFTGSYALDPEYLQFILGLLALV